MRKPLRSAVPAVAAVARAAVLAGAHAARAQARRSWRDMFGVPAVLLIDLDGSGLKVNELAPAVAHADAALGPFQALFAAGHPVTSRSAGPVCAHLGIRKLPTTRRPNSADHALLTAAHTAAATGAGSFVIIGADGAFAKLPGHVTVIRIGDAAISRRLSDRADAILELPKTLVDPSAVASRTPARSLPSREPARHVRLGHL